ncbi:hypothetical protein GIB67_025012 [Kingdonia uniflora]|uniref:Late embryogenesis abundant protein LEA-2 subgroup domain-containing protein n=1 Tax=Kingdonia uniflora TaxID=39325 RepID=A0A7J7N8C6_9MAGN|nr:hypothetical protein GIB67_025012 [Kingdonia uniflora]
MYMDNNQRVYPMDMEAPYPPKYVMLSENGGDFRPPPPYRRNIPRYQSHSDKNKHGCLKCMCIFYCFLFFFIFALAGLVAVLYNYYDPKIPDYKVEHMDVGAFEFQEDFSLYTEFIVIVRAENPNEKIGIIYGKDSLVEVDYSESSLCSGKLPSFHQGYKNTTLLNVVLTGKSEFGSGLQAALMDNRKTGRIPLTIKVRVPVSVVLGEFPLRQFTVLVNCSLVVDNLSPKKKVGILSSKYDVAVTF